MSTSRTGSPSRELDPEVPKSVLHRAIAASMMGNAVEWFDYGVYAVVTTYLGDALFKGGADDHAGVLLGFAVSFLFRPLGGIVWGPLGDRIGRKRVLALTIVLMSAATLGVALIPTYAAIGVGAPVLLFLLRAIQGFSAGGEYGGAATFMCEYAPPRRRGFYGSFLECGTLLGFSGGAALVLLLQAFISESDMQSWGWRLPFIIAAPLGLIGMYLRTKMEDTPVFKELEEKERTEQQVSGVYKDLFGKYLRPVVTLFCLVIAVNVVNYTLLSYSPTYFQSTLKMDETDALNAVLVGQLLMMLTLPVFGWLSDRIGRKPMWLFSTLATGIAAIPMYHLMGSNKAGAVIGFAVLGLLYAPQLATISATFPAMFPTAVRFAGVAIAYNVSTAAFGGTSPLVNDHFIASTGQDVFPAYYTAAACLVGFLAALTMVETKGRSVRGNEIPGTKEADREQEQLAAERVAS